VNLKQATTDIGKHQFNTVASAAMKILNAWKSAARSAGCRSSSPKASSILLRSVADHAHVCHAFGANSAYGDDILRAPWPEPLAEALLQDEIDWCWQINGKHRGSLAPSRQFDRDHRGRGLASDAAQKFLEARPAKKIIVVPRPPGQCRWLSVSESL